MFNYFFLEKVLKIQSSKGKSIIYTPKIILFRGFLSGTIVALAVLLAKFGGPIYGGIAASLPALFTSTLIITYYSQGKQFTKAISKSFLVGTVTIVLYATSIRYTYLSLGISLGTFIAICISLLSGLLLYNLVLKRTD